MTGHSVQCLWQSVIPSTDNTTVMSRIKAVLISVKPISVLGFYSSQASIRTTYLYVHVCQYQNQAYVLTVYLQNQASI